MKWTPCLVRRLNLTIQTHKYWTNKESCKEKIFCGSNSSVDWLWGNTWNWSFIAIKNVCNLKFKQYLKKQLLPLFCCFQKWWKNWRGSGSRLPKAVTILIFPQGVNQCLGNSQLLKPIFQPFFFFLHLETTKKCRKCWKRYQILCKIHNTLLHNECNGWNVCLNGTTSAPKSVLCYVVDKVKLIVPIWGTLLQCQYPELKFPIKVFHMS